MSQTKCPVCSVPDKVGADGTVMEHQQRNGQHCSASGKKVELCKMIVQAHRFKSLRDRTTPNRAKPSQ